MEKPAWVSFCISTYKRAELLKKQLELLLQQTFQHFEIVVSDNDPDASAKVIVDGLFDQRISYFHNESNLGMIKSFNKSIERARTDYIVMVTDDDPIDQNFLSDLFKLYTQYPECSIYCGFLRKGKQHAQIEVIKKNSFLSEILDTDKTLRILWSSCIMKRDVAIQVGKIPDYGSPHLADHAFIVMVGSKKGGIVVNKMYSQLTSHDDNFSKFNFEYYVLGCKGFYDTLSTFCRENFTLKDQRKAIRNHLGVWFISSFFNLKRYYTQKNDIIKLKQIEDCAQEILKFSFMKKFQLKYIMKKAVFKFKKYIFKSF